MNYEMPPPVDDRYRYWGEPPPEPSARLWYWLRRLSEQTHDWREVVNLLSDSNNYDDNAEKFGVYLWEWHHVLYHVTDSLIEGGRLREQPMHPAVAEAMRANVKRGPVDPEALQQFGTPATMEVKGYVFGRPPSDHL